MAAQDTSKIKERIMSVLRIKGPNLPVYVAREIGSSMLFTSAFLSELLSEKRIRISSMRVGNSPLYFISGQEPMLERFSQHLKSKEKDAFFLLKEKKFLPDSSQEPAIRVALREIKDFAIPFQRNNEFIWRFFTVPESEFSPVKKSVMKVQEKEQDIKQEIKQPTEEKPLNIFERAKTDEQEQKPKKQRKKTGKTKRKKTGKDNAFFDRLKESLAIKGIEILDVKNFSRNEIVIKARENGNEELVFALNRKKITDKDIIKAGKKSKEYNLPYKIVSLGEPAKKLTEIVDSIKRLSSIEKL